MAKITAVDIQHRTFKRALQGYDRAEVDTFLDELIESLEDEALARAALEAELADVRERISHFKAMEDSLQNTLLLAQRTADEVKATASRQAQLILDQARVAADRESGAIDSRINDSRREYHQIVELAEKAKSELRSMLMMYLALMDKQSFPATSGTTMLATTSPTGMLEPVHNGHVPVETGSSEPTATDAVSSRAQV